MLACGAYEYQTTIGPIDLTLRSRVPCSKSPDATQLNWTKPQSVVAEHGEHVHLWPSIELDLESDRFQSHQAYLTIFNKTYIWKHDRLPKVLRYLPLLSVQFVEEYTVRFLIGGCCMPLIVIIDMNINTDSF